MDWKKTKVPVGSKLFQVHNFTFMHSGKTYSLEIDEYIDGTFAGHGEHSTDKNFFIESVSGKSMNECLSALVSKIQERSK